jgi:hypothetical protein
MNKSISAFQFLSAHGNEPGPTHCPRTTGAIAGTIAAIPSILMRYMAGSLDSESQALGMVMWQIILLDALILIAAGTLYAQIFQRAANDLRSGWLFGISYGFLIWMLGPVTLWQWTTGKPLATGVPAIGIFAAQLVYGLVLGITFPFVNKLVQRRSAMDE